MLLQNLLKFVYNIFSNILKFFFKFCSNFYKFLKVLKIVSQDLSKLLIVFKLFQNIYKNLD